MPVAPNADCAAPMAKVINPPPTMAITINAEISFAFSGSLSMAKPMHMPNELAKPSAATNTRTRNIPGVEAKNIRTTARIDMPTDHGRHFPAEIRAKTTEPANAAIVFATK